MARFGALSATGESIVRFLRGIFMPLAPDQRPRVEQITTKSLLGNGGTPDFYTPRGTLTLLLYRIDIDLKQRSQVTWGTTPSPSQQQKYTLPLELRYLLTSWADQPEVQHILLGRALTAIAGHPSFGAGDLVESVGPALSIWDSDENFQLLPDDMSTEDRYQIWQALGRPFEISIPLKARTIFLESEALHTGGPIEERHLVYGTATPTETT